MHHQPAVRLQRQRLRAQPVDQPRAVGRVQHRLQRVAPVGPAGALGHGQQVQVMVAEHASCCAVQCHHAAQHRQRPRPAVDQVTEQVQRVAAG